MTAQLIAKKLIDEYPDDALRLVAEVFRLVAVELAIKKTPPKRFTSCETPARIADAVCAYYGIDHSDLMSELRMTRTAAPRRVFMWLLRSRLSMSYVEMGRYFNRNHTTIVYAVKNAETKDVEHTTAIANQLDAVKQIRCEKQL